MHTFVVNIVIIHTWTRFFIGTFNMYTPWTHVHNLNTCTHYEHMATSWPHVNCTHDEHIYTPGTHGHALNTVIQSRHKKTSLFNIQSWPNITQRFHYYHFVIEQMKYYITPMFISLKSHGNWQQRMLTPESNLSLHIYIWRMATSWPTCWSRSRHY